MRPIFFQTFLHWEAKMDDGKEITRGCREKLRIIVFGFEEGNYKDFLQPRTLYHSEISSAISSLWLTAKRANSGEDGNIEEAARSHLCRTCCGILEPGFEIWNTSCLEWQPGRLPHHFPLLGRTGRSPGASSEEGRMERMRSLCNTTTG